MDPLYSPDSQCEMTSPDSDSRRKTSKPAMEKRRRARINASLLELKSLLLQAMKEEGCRHSKMEKADILEMAVKHLRQLQRQQFAMAATMNPTVVNKYRMGYNECANEVTRYLGNVEGINVETRARLLRHLTTCLGENTRSRLPRMQSLLRGNNMATVVPMMTNGGVILQNGGLQGMNNNCNNNNNNNNVLQTAKLVDSNGSEMTVLIGLPNVAQTQMMTSQSQMTSQPPIFKVVPMTQKTVNSVSQPISVVAPMTSQKSMTVMSEHPNIMTSQSTVDGKEKTYQEVGVWQDDVWRPW